LSGDRVGLATHPLLIIDRRGS